MSTNVNIWQRVLGALVCGTLWAACSILGCDSSSPSTVRGAGADSAEPSIADDAGLDAGDAAANRCESIDSQCVGRPKCCPALVGRRVDREAHCARTESTPIGCATEEDACIYSVAFGCYVRSSDAGMEIFLTGYDWPDSYIPGGSHCDGQSYMEALEASMRVCP